MEHVYVPVILQQLKTKYVVYHLLLLFVCF